MKLLPTILAFCLLASGSLFVGAAPTEPLSLAGVWRFQLDRNDAGIKERWFERALPDEVTLPGSLPAQGIGDDVTVDTKWTGGIVANAIDGDPNTIWHTEWNGRAPGCPHEIVIDMQREVELAGFRYLPRQDQANGRFTGYEFYVGPDGKNWSAPAANGAFTPDAEEQTVRFPSPQRGRFIRFVAVSGPAKKPWAAVAELDVIAASHPR